jgi:AhpD family alkylhydroperoxidase
MRLGIIRDVGQPISDTATGKFTKRTYSRRELFADISFLTKNRRDIRWIMREKPITNAFRERLMLSVTSVYGCRYCSWTHTREALRSGIDQKEITGLLIGSVDNCPQEETVALLYAQHWADSNANPDPEATIRLEQSYGAEKAKTITILLRMIRVGNLWGNSWDCFLYWISFGTLGK